jgi:hypothetical protein
LLSKNFEYIGHALWAFQMRSPMIWPFNSVMQSRSVTFSTRAPSSTTTKLRPSSLLVLGPLSAGVVEENQRSSIPPRSPPNA